MIDNTKAALDFVRQNGPILPSQVSTTINTNILFASAILSELVDKKKVRITHVKKGGSPFYYVEGQEEKLMDLAENLKGKVKEAYDLVSQKQVIRDSDAEPWLRVALRDLKDFVIPLSVNFQGRHETFWKWYLTSNDDARGFIKKIVGGPKKEEKKEEVVKEIPQKEVVEQKKLVEQPKQEVEKGPEREFFDEILDYFSSSEMYVISQNIVRKGREFNFVIDVPSNLGKLRYFVKFKNKKSVTDKDLLSALDEAGKRNLPVLFLTNGELNKKAQKYVDENVSGQLVFRNV
jgi:hypothetical protein